MAVSEVYGGLIVREGKILMFYEEKEQVWNVPNGECNHGELGADTAERVSEELTGCSTEVTRYKKRLKTDLTKEDKEFTWQPYHVEIEGEPSEGEWVPLDDLDSKDLVPHLSEIKEKIVKRL